MDGPPPPPDCGQRLLVTLVDQRAAADHARPYYSIPISHDVSMGYRDISYRTFANAVNRCSHWIIQEFGRSSNFEPLAYLGSPDLRYQILLLAAAKTGHVVSTSPRHKWRLDSQHISRCSSYRHEIAWKPSFLCLTKERLLSY